MVRASVCALVMTAFAAAPVAAGDQVRRECRQACEETLRSCKADCRPERDAGDAEASEGYVDCDGACHQDYTACVDDCADDE